LLEAEMDLNYFVHANARGTCARFMGCLELGPKDGGELYNGTLTEGLWLMFLNEGENTVEKLMLDGTVALASAMRCDDKSELGVARFAMKSLLASLVKLHEVGVVHRDIKPANIIVAEQDGGALKLIDLGAAALCLPDPQNPKGGQLLNYYPGVGPADPRYCADDELFLLPEGAPRPNVDNALKLWKAHLPDRFDCVSAGITLGTAVWAFPNPGTGRLMPLFDVHQSLKGSILHTAQVPCFTEAGDCVSIHRDIQ
jgi:serine/threonine protein kinase